VTYQINRAAEREVFDLDTLTPSSPLDPEVGRATLRDRACRALDFAEFGHERANHEQAQAHVENLLVHKDSADSEIARRVLTTGSPLYRSAFGKYCAGRYRFPEEERALALGAGSTGGFAVVYQLDPTFIPTSNFSVNPFRAISNVETIAGTNEWRGVTTAGVTAAYGAEGSESSDNSPTLVQPALVAQRASVFIPFSIELGQDVSNLEASLARVIQDAKDDLEATQFTTGTGLTVYPQGVLTGATTAITSAGSATFAIGDMYSVEQALPPRFRPGGSWVANRYFYNKIRAFDTAGGAGMWLGYPNPLQQGLANNVPTDGSVARLMGYPAFEDSAMSASLATGQTALVIGDFRFFKIVDRIGLDVEVIPHLFGSVNRFPTGQRGLFAYWRNTSKVLSASAFVTLTIK
jgi:HK97 family phage major capsid protein